MQRWHDLLGSYGPVTHRYYLVTQTVTQGNMSIIVSASPCTLQQRQQHLMTHPTSWSYIVRSEVRQKWRCMFNKVYVRLAPGTQTTHSRRSSRSRLQRLCKKQYVGDLAMGHTWTAHERKVAKSFARSLSAPRLQFAQQLTNRPTASAEDVVDILVQHKQELTCVAGSFGVTKPDMIKFFRSQRQIKADLHLTSLSKTSPEELKAVLESYFTKGWKGSARALLTEAAQQRDDNTDGPKRDLYTLRKITFSDPARAQIAAFLLRLKEQELAKVRKKLHVGDADIGGSKEQQVRTILAAVADAKGPYMLLNAMAEWHVRTFLSEHWGQIAKANYGESTDEDYIEYDIQTCQLCILWAWANM